MDKDYMRKFLNNKYLKLVFSIAIIGAAIPSIYQDFTYGHGGVWTHYGMVLVGILYLIESLIWVAEVWENKVD